MKEAIKAARTIAVGGGAVGVETATGIKSYCPQKLVVVVHSRCQLLPHFGLRLHEYVLGKLEKMEIELQCGERPRLPFKTGVSNSLITDAPLHFSKEGERHFVLIVRYLFFVPPV